MFSKVYQYGTTKEKVCKNSNMFLSNLPKQICINASFGLRSLGRANRNGIGLVLKLEFNPEN
jgi:hypothetical protein